MALDKVNYISEETVISAENLNQIQDEIIKNGQQIVKNEQQIVKNGQQLEVLKSQVATLAEATVE